MLDNGKKICYNISANANTQRKRRAVVRFRKIKNRIERNDFYEQIMQIRKSFCQLTFEN